MVVQTSWELSSCEEVETELLALPSRLLATAMAVRNVWGEGGALLRSGEADLELIGNLKIGSLFSSDMKFLIVWLYRSCYHRVEKMSLNIKVDLL